MKHRIITGALLAFAIIAAIGCTTSGTYTESDREVHDQTVQGTQLAIADIEDARAQIPAESDAKLKLDQAQQKLEVVALNNAQQEQVHGKPEAKTPFSPEASKAKREKSTKDHATPGWVGVALGIGGTVLGAAATLFGMPWLAPIFPKLAGKLGAMAKTGVQIITAVRAKAETQGGSIHITDLLEIAKDKNVQAGVQALVTKTADAHEEEMGHEFKMKLDSTPAEIAAATP